MMELNRATKRKIQWIVRNSAARKITDHGSTTGGTTIYQSPSLFRLRLVDILMRHLGILPDSFLVKTAFVHLDSLSVSHGQIDNPFPPSTCEHWFPAQKQNLSQRYRTFYIVKHCCILGCISDENTICDTTL